MTAIPIEHQGDASGSTRAVQIWLALVAFLVFAMIVVGGATRLTDSGLSITEWKPILGAIPPLSTADWQDAFDKYRQIPEYELVNQGMSLEEFKPIFWWEWAHRFLGRVIGLAFALPFAVFWMAGRIPAAMTPKLIAILALGALQGVIGWYMVQSGLVDRVDVSQYRLALHLGVAFLILGSLVWVMLSCDQPQPGMRYSRSERVFALGILGLLSIQIVLGAFVAGLKAGLTYNTWPLMDGRLIPDGLGTLAPWYLNLTENVTAVQFNHRIMAYAVVAAVIIHVVRLWRSSRLDASALSLVAATVAQAAIGVWTLLAGVPLWLGLLHQGGAAALLVIAVWHVHRTTCAQAASPSIRPMF